jgi:hypothetical protein
MANTTYKDVAIRIAGNGTSVLTTITAYVNKHDLKRTCALIDSSAYSDANRRYIPGLSGTTVSVNGWVNTTTDGILGPLVASQTSVSKRFELRAYASRFYNGNVFLSDVTYSGSLNNMQTFSANMTFDGAVNRTSVTLT